MIDNSNMVKSQILGTLDNGGFALFVLFLKLFFKTNDF